VDSLSQRQDHGGHPRGRIHIPRSEYKHPVATGGARLHRMEMDSRWNILYLIGILHPVPWELQEIRARPYMEIAFGEQMQIIRMDPHTQQNSHGRQLTIEEYTCEQ
jgi:hypothetical protein